MSAQDTQKKKSLMIPMRIFCLLLAVVIWVVVVNLTSDNYEDSFEVDIRVDGNEVLSEKDISVYDKSESKITVLVRGHRDDVRSLSAEDFRAYIDVSLLDTAGKHEVPVKISAPEKVLVVSYEPSLVEISTDKIESRDYPVTVEFRNYSKEKSYVLESYAATPSYVTVRGPVNVLDRIETVKAVANLGGISLSHSLENIPESIVLLDKEKNTVDQDYLTVSAEQFSISVNVKQTVSLPLSYEFAAGFDSSRIAGVELSVRSVEVKGDPSVFDSLKKINVLTVGPNTPQDSEVSLSGLIPDGVTLTDSAMKDSVILVHINYKPEVTTQPVQTTQPEVTTQQEIPSSSVPGNLPN